MTPRCEALHPRAHICRCDLKPDDHDEPGWHECGDCGREWHDDDHRLASDPADLPRAARKAAEGYQTADDPNEAKERP